MLTCPEPSFEGLCRLFASGHPSLGLYSNEGGQFIGGYGMSEEKKLATISGLSSLWDGEPIRRVRAGEGATIMPGRRLAVHLMAQPDIASIMLSDPMLAEQGLLSRVLPSAPDTLAGTRMWREPLAESREAISLYQKHILKILKTKLPIVQKIQNELCPRELPLDSSATKMWIGFVNKIEEQIGVGGPLESVRGFANKLPEHAARLAGVLALTTNIDAPEVCKDQMAAGIMLAQHYLAESLRLFATTRVNADLLLAQRTLAWLQTIWKEENDLVSLPDIYQWGPNAVRDQKTAIKIVDILCEHCWLVPMGSQEVNKKPRRDSWKILGVSK